jgi:hypothetical protein
MNIVDLLTTTNASLAQLTILIPSICGFCAALASVVPESTPIIGYIIHKIGFNFGKAANKL